MSTTIAAESRRRLGRVGVGLTVPIAPADDWRDSIRRVERAGFGAAWVNEAIGGREVFAQLGLLLAASERIVLGSSIANTWARHPAAMQGGAAVLADAYPGRFALGLGVSMDLMVEESGQTWTRPLTRMRDYLDRMDTAVERAPRPSVPYPRLLAALGPKMTELARDRADGAIPAAMPVEHTRRTRHLLGPEPLLIVQQLIIPEADPTTARKIIRGFGMPDFPSSPYTKALRGLGYSEADLAGGGTDAVIDARFGWGDPPRIAARLQDHLDAGADHVVISVPGANLGTITDQLECLAPALTALAVPA
ncbi:TIGR03620 family F420-dependent LLM class oxidoreductase [Microlunatus speluncae]|uniref:TIGR03620 family F420-dependent LLM class oxidoreductase n=1 Tax=Microlunatus speluncae TaxID=2594267 RepID=UPI0012664403|nr:TIGR03620 family F420-dependent LLM class oxidoreductase [Microlunatus speluncae]